MKCPTSVLWLTLGLALCAGCGSPAPAERILAQVAIIPPPPDEPARTGAVLSAGTSSAPPAAVPSERSPAVVAAVPQPRSAPPVAAPVRESPPPAAVPSPSAASAPPVTQAAAMPTARAATPAAATAAGRAPVMPPPPLVIYFDPDAYKVPEDYRGALQERARWLRERPGPQLVIEAFADGRGSGDYNLALSKKRAETVARLLTSFGAPPGRLELRYHGERRAEARGRGEATLAGERRVELTYR